MTFDLHRILESKERFRRNLAARPVAEKLAMLDVLRERTLTIRQAGKRANASAIREPAPEYRAKSRNE